MTASGSLKQGLIATHNSNLFQELFNSPSPEMAMRESREAPVNKLYVEGIEGGHFTEEDEDKYKFISDKIEDFDEKQYSMLLDSSRKENNSREKSRAELTPRNDGPSVPPSRQLSSQSQRTQFVVKSRRQHLTAEERDLEELQREERYQGRLRQKLKDLEENQNVFIPKLELGDSDEEEKLKEKNSVPFDINLRDSLEDEPPQKHLHKPEKGKKMPQQASLDRTDSLEDQPHPIEQQQHQQQQQHQYMQDSLEWPAPPGPPPHIDEYHQPQPGVHGNDPLSRMFYPEVIDERVQMGPQWGDSQLPPAPIHADEGYMGMYAEQEIEVEQYSNARAYNQHYESYPSAPTQEELPQASEAERYDSIRRKHDPKTGSQNDLRRRKTKQNETQEKPKSDVDFIEMNKQVMSKKRETKSYSTLHAKKKQPEAPIKPSSAEYISQGPQRQNMGRSDGPPSTRGEPGHAPMRKYPSESRVDDIKLQRARAAPHRVGPIAHRPVPFEAFQDSAPNTMNSPHAVYAEGGHRYDVDVNVKTVSTNHNYPDTQDMHAVPAVNQHSMYSHDNNYYAPRHNHYGSVGHLEGAHYTHNAQGYGQQRQPGHSSDAHGYNYHPHVNHGGNHGNQYYHGANGDGCHEQVTQQYNYRQPYHQQQQQEDWPQQSSIRGSNRGSIATTDRSQTPLGSPYQVLPPIIMDDQNDPPLRIKASPRHDLSPGREEGSYMEAFRSKKNKKTEYKKYTLNDYRKLNMAMEVHRGGLGPEVNGEEHRNRKEKLQRQQEYARMIAEKNRKDMEAPKARPGISKRPEDEDYDDAFQRHAKAKEYAKSVPKPRSKPPSGAPPSGSSSQRSYSSEPNKEGTTLIPSSGVSRRDKSPAPVAAETIDLEALQKRHEQEKQKAERIRQNVEGVH